MRSLRLRWRLLVPLTLFTLVTFACSSDESQESSTTITAAQEVTATTAAPSTTAKITTTTLPTRFEGQLEGLTVIDENTFTVELVEPDPEFPLRLGVVWFFAVPEAAWDDLDAQNEMPIGNGPFMMHGPWEHDLRIRAVPNPAYLGPNPARVDALEWVIHSSEEAAYSQVLAGELDVMHPVPANLFGAAVNAFGDDFHETDQAAIEYLGIPAYLEQYTRDHRRALSMAIDRERLIEEAFDGIGTPALAMVPPMLGGRDRVCANWDYHPEEARRLWAQAGGFDEITLWTNTDFDHERWVQAVADMWSETLEIDPSAVIVEATADSDTYLGTLWTGEATGPFRLGWAMDYPSPLDFLEPLFASYRIPPNGPNLSYHEARAFDEALAAGKEIIAVTGRPEDALADYQAAEDILCGNVAVIPIRLGSNPVVHSDNVRNVFIDAFGDIGYTVIEAEDGTVRIYAPEPDSLFSVRTETGAGVVRALNTGLVQYDPVSYRPYNAHARSITSDDGGKTWTIVLNPGWTFHDGTPNDAASYVKTWSYSAEIGSFLFRNIVGAEELSSAAGS